MYTKTGSHTDKLIYRCMPSTSLPSWAVLVPCWVVLGACWAVRGRLGGLMALLLPLWAVLKSSWVISAHRGENVGPFRPIGFAKNTDCPRVLYTCGDPLGYRRRGAVYRIPRTAFQLLSAVPRTAWGCHGLAAALGAGDRSLAGDWGWGVFFVFSKFP